MNGFDASHEIEPAALFDSAELDELREVIADPSNENLQSFRRKVEGRFLKEGKLCEPPSEPSPAELRYALLRFLVAEERSRLQLQGLTDNDPTFDRDEAVLKTWRRLEQADSEYVKSQHFSLAYHRQRLFAWFVDRYDLTRARKIFARNGWAQVGLQFVPTIGAAIALFLIKSPSKALALVFAGYAAPTIIWSAYRLSPVDFVQSLVPRLAGTAAAGAALLFSASQLLSFFRTDMSFVRSLVLLALAVGYLALETLQRVHPRLRWRELTNRVANVVFLALTHAMTLVLLILPALRTFGGTDQFSATQLFAFTTAVFTVGLVLNVIWAEEPITRPL